MGGSESGYALHTNSPIPAGLNHNSHSRPSFLENVLQSVGPELMPSGFGNPNPLFAGKNRLLLRRIIFCDEVPAQYEI